MNGVFDPDTFMNTVETGAMSTEYVPIPQMICPGIIKEVKPRKIEGKDGNDDSYLLDIEWLLDNEDVRQQLDRKELVARQSIFLDMTPQGTLDMGNGKNVQLGRLREALKQNDPMQPWALSSLRGAGPAMCKIGHRKDTKVEGRVYSEVQSVAKID
jgi:hypothetical protein